MIEYSCKSNRPATPAVPSFLEADVYEDIHTLMVSLELPPYYPALGRSASFSHHMSQVADNTDVYLLTANSAIPVADAIRGYYDELGQKTPEIGYVTADSTNSRSDCKKVVESESERLKHVVKGASVTIFDQYVATGATLGLAQLITTTAGAAEVYAARDTRWYEGTLYGHVEREGVTSRHREFMRRVGKESALRVASSADIVVSQ